jgi:WD40 repeat protein
MQSALAAPVKPYITEKTSPTPLCHTHVRSRTREHTHTHTYTHTHTHTRHVCSSLSNQPLSPSPSLFLPPPINTDNENHLVAGCGDNSIRVFAEDADSDAASANPGDNVPSYRLLAQAASSQPSDVNSVTWHPHGDDLLASAHDNGTVSIWSFE